MRPPTAAVPGVPSWAATVDADAAFTKARTDLITDNSGSQNQIQNLVLAARDERPDALGPILSQDGEFFTDFLTVLTARPGSHPKTFRVLNIASLIASFAALYFKDKYEVPRPSQICPALLPPITVPGHASWPSGHATQAHFMANCMLKVFAATGTGMTTADQNVLNTDLAVLAASIARNREIAGLHYPGDSDGGARLAELLATSILTSGAVPLFDSAISDAAGEWS